MDTVNEILGELERAGVTLAAVGDRLRFHPMSAVSPSMLQRMKDHKVEILAALRHGAAVPAAPPRPERFRNWVLRPDCRGQMGWERPGLSTSDRWWVRAMFEDMPIPPSPEAN